MEPVANTLESVKNKITQAGAVPASNVAETSFEGHLKRMHGEIAKALPKHFQSERFTRLALTAFRQSPELQKCSPISIIAALMESAQLGLEPNTSLGHAYLIPFGGGGKVHCRV